MLCGAAKARISQPPLVRYATIKGENMTHKMNNTELIIEAEKRAEIQKAAIEADIEHQITTYSIKDMAVLSFPMWFVT